MKLSKFKVMLANIFVIALFVSDMALAINEDAKKDPTAEQVLVSPTATKPAEVKSENTEAPATTSQSVDLGDVSGTTKYKITCVSGTDTREITAITQADNSVGVVYKKFDTLKTMAVAKNDPAYADQVADKIKANLETAGFTCTKE